jgi:hypothetical protein
MERLEVLIALAKARLECRSIDPETIPGYRQGERQKAFEKLIEGKLESDVWLNLFLMKRDLWINDGPAMSGEILTDHKRISFTIRPVEGGFELEGAKVVVHLADDEQFSDRLLVAVGAVLDATPESF